MRATKHPHAGTQLDSHAVAQAQDYVILFDFPLQQSFSERASVLRDMYIACIVLYEKSFNIFTEFVTNILILYGINCGDEMYRRNY
jgi:hypothetical protein